MKKKAKGYNLLVNMQLGTSMNEGDKATKLIRQTSETRHIPVIVFSALPNLKGISKNADASAIIEKPFDLIFLTETIRKYIS